MNKIKLLLVTILLTLPFQSCTYDEFCGEVIGYGERNGRLTHILRNNNGEVEERVVIPNSNVYVPGTWICVE